MAPCVRKKFAGFHRWSWLYGAYSYGTLTDEKEILRLSHRAIWEGAAL